MVALLSTVYALGSDDKPTVYATQTDPADDVATIGAV